jgi:hypothetical protein
MGTSGEFSDYPQVEELERLDDEMFPLIDEEAGGFEAAADRFAARL